MGVASFQRCPPPVLDSIGDMDRAVVLQPARGEVPTLAEVSLPVGCPCWWNWLTRLASQVLGACQVSHSPKAAVLADLEQLRLVPLQVESQQQGLVRPECM